jgi:hypothetical protein
MCTKEPADYKNTKATDILYCEHDKSSFQLEEIYRTYLIADIQLQGKLYKKWKFVYVYSKSKVNSTLQQAMKAQIGDRVIALFFL